MKCRLHVLALSALLATAARGQDANESVVITGSVGQRAADEAPYAITLIGRESLRNAGPQVNLSEALAQVPGLVVNNRSNYAQDLQISARGFGARAGFGVRGLRLYADGIPATGPDGQGQVSHVDIAGAQRVEVLRGPFSVLYGNSSGGVIAVFGAPAKAREVEVDVDGGSFGLAQARVAVATPLDGGFDLRASASTLRTEGFRPQSDANKTQGNVRVGWQGGGDSVTVLANVLDQPALDPLGLTRAQFDLGPDQTAQTALDFNTRKNTRQSQAGASWRHRFGEGALRDTQVAVFGGARHVQQWLAITPPTQTNVRHGGGVIAFDRLYHGIDARAHWTFGPVELVTGAALERQRDDRKGYENFIGTGAAQVVGVTGRLRRDEIDSAQTQDVYAQGEWTLPADVLLVGGVRSGRVRLAARDAYLSNGDDSGNLAFHYTNPVLGLHWKPAAGLNLHASLARGFESPTLGELAYRADGTGGFNTALKPQSSRQAEVGAKWRDGGLALDATLFDVATTDEIGVATNAGGRSAFQNIGRTQRRGLEAGLTWRPTGEWNAWKLQLSGSVLRATYEDDFLVCAGIPCAAANVPVPAGNRIAGAPSGNAYAELAWAGGAWGELAVEVRGLGATAANDRNTDIAAGFATGSLRWVKGVPMPVAGLRMEWPVRVDNVANRRYAGSVIVNDANGRYYEPGAPRSVLLSLRFIGSL
jgi:iron complex outermembrane receptor protein